MWISRPTRYVGLMLWFSFYYLSYRYFLQINSSTTSAIYTDTPTVLQAGKYLLFLLITLFYAIWGRRQHGLTVMQKIEQGYAALYAFLALFPLALFVFDPQPYYIEVGIFFVFLIPATRYLPEQISFRWLSNQIAIFVAVSTACEIMQILLYHLFGRLPALAHYNVVMVRYGSIWDDPNGYAVFMSFLIPFVYFRYQKRPWLVVGLEGILLVFIIMTQSMTGMAVLCLALLLGGGWLLWAGEGQMKAILGLLAVVPLLLAMLAVSHVSSPIPAQVIQSKSESIAGHEQAWLVLEDYLTGSGTTIGSLKPQEVRPWQKWVHKKMSKLVDQPPRLMVNTESGYVNLLINGGWFYLFVYLMAGVLGLIMLRRALLKELSGPGLEVCYGAYFYLMAYFIAMLNLPCEKIFPLNTLMVISLLLAHSARRKSWVRHLPQEIKGELY